MADSYLKHCDAIVRGIKGNQVTFDRTVLHPLSGGVANDLGNVTCHGISYDVIDVGEDEVTGDVIHAMSRTPAFQIGDAAEIALDWDRRYALMKLHTAAHILSSIMYNKYRALITGGHIDPAVA
ncbi:alanyl-tRNA editing protein AlaX, partial [bacterium]